MSSSISSMLNSRMRLNGYASGLDVDSMVQQLMKLESAKVDKAKQSKQRLEWQRDDYRSITSLLRGLKDKYLNITSSSNLLSSTAFNKTAVSVSDASIVSVTGTSTAGVTTHSVTVNNIATTNAKTSNSYITNPNAVAADVNASMESFTGLTAGDVALRIGTTNYTFAAGESIQTFLNNVNAANSAYTIAYNGTNFTVADKATGNPVTGVTTSISGTFMYKAGLDIDTSTQTLTGMGLAVGANALTIGTKTYTVQDGETVSAFMARVNNDTANTTYRLSYDTTGKRFIVATKGTGVNTTTISGDFLTKANYASSSFNVSGIDASFSIDGVEYKSSTNSFTADGLTYNFLKNGTTNVSSTRDVEGMLKNIKEFVDAYNNIITTINTETTEKKYRDYAPLTDDQKSAMSENDIKLWEEKAKSGSLNGDSLLIGLADRLKTAMYDQINVSSGGTSLSSIGISTTSYLDKGKLTLDETKLREALTNNPDKVVEMFTKESTSVSSYDPDASSTDKSTRYSENGVLYRMDDILNDYIRTTRNSDGKKGSLIEKAGFTNDVTEFTNYMQGLIDDQDDIISDLYEKLMDKEDYYYSKFTAMETAISNMNSQSSWLTQQFSTGS